MKKDKSTNETNSKIEKYFHQYTTEQRLKIIANLIIDRILEKGITNDRRDN